MKHSPDAHILPPALPGVCVRRALPLLGPVALGRVTVLTSRLPPLVDDPRLTARSPVQVRWEKGRAPGCFQPHMVLPAPHSSPGIKHRAIRFSPFSCSRDCFVDRKDLFVIVSFFSWGVPRRSQERRRPLSGFGRSCRHIAMQPSFPSPWPHQAPPLQHEAPPLQHQALPWEHEAPYVSPSNGVKTELTAVLEMAGDVLPREPCGTCCGS